MARLEKIVEEWGLEEVFEADELRYSIEHLPVEDEESSARELPEINPVILTETEQRVWTAWGQLPDGESSPVKRIARQLGMAPADVAFVVYPAETFGRWEDNQEPDL